MWQTAEEINIMLAQRVKAIRKRKGLTQTTLALKSNVSYGSIKRFEESGNISLISLTRICIALGCENELNNIFTNVGYKNITEVINEK